MAIWGCGSPAHCCQPAVAGGVIYADLRSELSTHLALRALFTQSSPVCEPLLQAFPFPSTLGEVTLHQLSQAHVFVYSSHGKWAFPPSPVEFSSHHHFYKLSHSWLLGVCHRSCLLQPACCEGFPLPHSSMLRVPHHLCYMSFLLLLIIQFFFPFYPGWGSVCPGGCADLAQGCLWENRVLLSSPSGHCCLVVAAWGPSWFLHLK
jgi:hypothetical protein